MNCYYCDKIKLNDPDYDGFEASFDLGSAAPRCPRHWRFDCGKCRRPSHFMSTAFDSQVEKFYCSSCAAGKEDVVDGFWAWKYSFRYRSPWSGDWHTALDRLEYEQRHPFDHGRMREDAKSAISQERHLVRYPERTTYSTDRKSVV